ncbi:MULTISPECIES: hypothetical protein [Corynebacterium]|uniref:hypothetical protein n=1 Tax=Corynebacterium TaxID=1716 RepID=UPI00254FC3EE|nr:MULTISPECIES: hypothetical protein [Corynebacterium]MDK7180139.1 hypothetical protein [Corynebacterium riegelii]MDK8664497.1 hypothetical protein [Corynebacterium coyleae]MDK8707516.1 hypothetical protein [Corynebacterium coyleae]MDK8734400.1 hypothetical protein [Corynebacterium coyleae]MDK8893611.1 hypothetical protein [Corynebacterium coyleae]
MTKQVRPVEDVESSQDVADQVRRLTVELEETCDALLFEIDRDRKLLAGIQKRDRKIAELKQRVRVLEKKLGIPDEERAGLPFLPNSLRGKDVPRGVLWIKKKYWAMRSTFRKAKK